MMATKHAKDTAGTAVPSAESETTQPTASEAQRSFSSKLSLEDIRVLQAQFSAERGWEKYLTPRNLVLALVGEVGELSEIFQWRGEVECGLPDWSESDKEHLGQELSDVLIYLVSLAESCEVDLPTAVVSKFELNRRKYPASKVYGSSKKYTEYEEQGSKLGECNDQ